MVTEKGKGGQAASETVEPSIARFNEMFTKWGASLKQPASSEEKGATLTDIKVTAYRILFLIFLLTPACLLICAGLIVIDVWSKLRWYLYLSEDQRKKLYQQELDDYLRAFGYSRYAQDELVANFNMQFRRSGLHMIPSVGLFWVGMIFAIAMSFKKE